MRRRTGIVSIVLPAAVLGWGLAIAAQQPAQDQKQAPPPEKVVAPEVPPEVQEKAKTYKGSPTPPRSLTQQSDGHWTPYEPPAKPEGAEWYDIQKGDTLSQLAQQKLGTWLLWPQIWDQNPYIKDAHWIYPGDPLLISKPQVVSETGPVEPEEITPKAGGEPAPSPVLNEETVQPPINANDVYCSGFISKSYQRPHMTILAGQRAETVGWAQGDVVYLNEGKKDGVEPGNVYQVLRVNQIVYHPVTGKEIGTYFLRVGKLKILAVQDRTSIAEITQSCDVIYPGNPVVPWQAIPIPWDVKRGKSLPLVVDNPSQTKGRVIWSKDRLESTGMSSIIYIDLGSKNQLVPGDKVWVYHYPAAQGTLLETTSDLYRQQKIDVGVKDIFRPPKVGTYRGTESQESSPQDDRQPAAAPAETKQAEDSRVPKGEMTSTDQTGVKSIPLYLGEGVVITTEANTACVKLLQSSQEITMGDWVMTE